MDSLNLQGSTQSLNFRLRTVLPFADPGYFHLHRINAELVNFYPNLTAITAS